MKSKKIVLISIILVVALAATVGVSFAAWQTFKVKPTGTWEVESNIPTDLIVGTTTVVNPDAKYQGHTGLDEHGFFRSASMVELTPKGRDMTIKGVAVVTCKKGNTVVNIPADKLFKVVFVTGEGETIADSDTLAMTKEVKVSAQIVVIFPDLSDVQYQNTVFSIKVVLSEVVSA